MTPATPLPLMPRPPAQALLPPFGGAYFLMLVGSSSLILEMMM